MAGSIPTGHPGRTQTTTKPLIHLSDILSTGTWVRQRDSVKQTKGKSDQMRR